MRLRMRLLKGANALLYLGPLLAGMSGMGWGTVLPFVAVFVLWLMILRPEQWPATTTEWLTGRALGAAFTQILSQILLVTVLLGFGRGVVGLAGVMLDVHPMLPIAISTSAIFLSRMLWDARDAAAAGLFLDDEAEEARVPHAAAEALGSVIPLLTQPEDADATTLRQALDAILHGPSASQRLDALKQAISTSGRFHAALRRALVIWTTEPEVVAPGRVSNALSAAFELSNGSPDLLRLFLPRALALVAAFPDRASGFPTGPVLRQAASADLDGGPNSDLPADLRADLRDGLLALARAVETAQAKARPAADTDHRDAELHGTPSPV